MEPENPWHSKNAVRKKHQKRNINTSTQLLVPPAGDGRESRGISPSGAVRAGPPAAQANPPVGDGWESAAQRRARPQAEMASDITKPPPAENQWWCVNI